ncbi:P-loop containing nucleoside triphosphate hydrolase protein [Metschnikowia bicuspidata]|uniref:P-loop containing nucleoside triphosphate hydrolase protein n=1 Tax=Metschnikowia bicuspidata TaxID=27322 RepID=A0A4P9ZA44_9ASCO|nr:P-loop containing nucleoside triphosphate hydrolase protein [Metschnikowia bicuspidata]
MKETCPLCFKSFPLQFLERHVNICLDSNNPGAEGGAVKADPKKDKTDVFAAMGLKADSKGSAEKGKKDGVTLTSILLAEKRLKKKQEELDRKIKEEEKSREAETGNTQKPAVVATKPFLEAGNPDIGPGASLSEVLGEITPVSSQGGENEPNSEIGTENAPLVPLMLDTRAARARDEMAKLRRESELPLAHRLRPTSLDDFFGQEKLAGENGILRNFITSKNIPSFILWGVPGVGKTSLARIIASASQHRFVELSGTESNAKNLRETFVMAQNERQRSGVKTILFLDEIHRFNKAVQDLLFPAIEKGVLTVIGATTENPSFSLNNALLSRMHTFVMEPLSHEALVRILSKGLLLLNKSRKFVHKLHLIAFDKDALDYVAQLSAGDSRVALNLLESVNAYLSGLQFRTIQVEDAENEKLKLPDTTGIIKVSLAELKPLLKTRNFQQSYDRNGDNHYDAISAFHKSVRGSDADAAVFYLVKMLHGGEDPLFIARRMIVIASEDIGLRDSLCLPFAIAVLEALQFIGMPEGEIILAHSAVKLARAPKSTKLYRALRNAQALFKENPHIAQLPVPIHLRNAATSLMKDLGYAEHYKYNPLYQHGLIIQLFLPPEVKDLRLVEDTHLGQSRDEAVEESRYDALEKENQEYRRFKKLRKSAIMQHMTNYRKASKTCSALGELSSDAAERLSSYDENLSKDAQPDYFDGTEQDKYSQGEFDEPY